MKRHRKYRQRRKRRVFEQARVLFEIYGMNTGAARRLCMVATSGNFLPNTSDDVLRALGSIKPTESYVNAYWDRVYTKYLKVRTHRVWASRPTLIPNRMYMYGLITRDVQ